MVRIALHQNLALEDGDPGVIAKEAARYESLNDAEIVPFENSIDLLDKLTSTSVSPIDLVVLPYELPGMTGIMAVQEAREVAPLLHSVLLDDSLDHISEAISGSVDGYLAQPATSEKLHCVLSRQIKEIKELHEKSFLLNTRKGMCRIRFDRVLYCETSGHDQVVHLIDGTSTIGRYSSQGMFELLSEDKRFYKVGSSYIVNLNEVVEAHIPNGVMVLSDGTKLNIPSRLRKAFEGALLGMCA